MGLTAGRVPAPQPWVSSAQAQIAFSAGAADRMGAHTDPEDPGLLSKAIVSTYSALVGYLLPSSWGEHTSKKSKIAIMNMTASTTLAMESSTVPLVPGPCSLNGPKAPEVLG